MARAPALTRVLLRVAETHASKTPVAGSAGAGRGEPLRPQARCVLDGGAAEEAPASIAAGKAAYDAACAVCHGDRAQGAVRAGLTISIIEEQGRKQAPDLTDAQWDHGSSDGEIYTVLKRGLPPTMMPGFDGAISDESLWGIVNYLRTLAAGR
jgi:mono/diheme cytochrome c family protein